MVYRWKKTQKMPATELEDLAHKEIQREFGDFGEALCGPRFRVFGLGDSGVVVKVRFEAQKHVLVVFKEFNSLQLVHIAGSAELARKAIRKKLPRVVVSDTGLW